MHTNRPHRLKAFNYLGPYRYFLTFCTDFRAKVFVDSDVVELVFRNFCEPRMPRNRPTAAN